MPEETPAQRRRRLGTAGQTRVRTNRRPAPLNITRPTQAQIEKGNTPSPSPTKEKEKELPLPNWKTAPYYGTAKKDDDDEVPAFLIPGTERVVRDIGEVGVGRFGPGALGGKGSLFGPGVTVFGGKEEGFKKPGLNWPEVPLGGRVLGTGESVRPGFPIKGAAAAFGTSTGGLGFGGVEASPWSDGAGVKGGEQRPTSAIPVSSWTPRASNLSAAAAVFSPAHTSLPSQQQTTAPPSTPWANHQHFTAPPPTPWTARPAGFGDNRPSTNFASSTGSSNIPPSGALGTEASTSGQNHPLATSLNSSNFNTRCTFPSSSTGLGAYGGNDPSAAVQLGGDPQVVNQDEDIDLLDASPEVDEDLDIVSRVDSTQWNPAFGQAPAAATFANQVFESQNGRYEQQNQFYNHISKQRESEQRASEQRALEQKASEQREAGLKEQLKRDFLARRNIADVPSMPPQTQSGTPILGQFLVAINGFIKADNEAGITDYMVIEPPYSDMYNKLISELQQNFPPGSEEVLEEKCRHVLSHARDGVNGSPSWSQFIRFVAQYLSFLRDVDMDQSKYLQTYELLVELQKKANSALTHAQLGHLVLGTVMSAAKAMSRLAIGLDKQPHLIAHLKSAQITENTNENEARTLPERAVEFIRPALSNCVTDRASKVTRDGKIEGKQRGAYNLANICLKIYFQCRSFKNATLVFQSIGSTTMPISAYSRRDRITYLYYLGRFWFQNNHFERARQALQQAYDECSAQDHSVKQRRYILVFLIASSLIVGRFPSQAIFQRPEAQGLQERFFPLMQAIRSGNLALFRQHMSLENPHSDWFLHFRILLQLKNRCEILVWRSLVRKIFILNGTKFDPNNPRAAVTFDLDDLVAALSALEKQSRRPEDETYIDPDLDGAEDQAEAERLPDVRQIESILASLVDQGLLRGFIAHRQHKFSIMGVRNAGGDALAAGFPQPWRVLEQKVSQEEGYNEIPGWQTGAPGSMATGGAMAGKVINLAGLRQVGAS
ncbi:PCI domain-containing protein [Fulvia fulva]|nr:PCI domain-containing protein [Fulvia fulva]KAK4614619.1 PCI domain-containing protein [Fulvia fulva]WPV20139.1 PCI domain-containing protein [Fulvia fulva]WPV35259.1 PCI domain-containing protein [Fulvia fulva]